jgi:acyl dehydratase/YHS domain-containing protein
MAIDPACGVEIDPGAAATTVEHAGRTYHFCSEGCADAFAADPDSYLADPHPHLMTIGGLMTQKLPFKTDPEAFELEVAEPGELGVGDRSTFTKTITDEDVRKFAEASGDTNALHLNDAFAEGTRFGRRIVHGTLVSGTISAALAALPGLTIYLSENLEFKRPVDIGTTITAICEIVEVLEDDRYRLTTRVENEDGEIVIHGTATVLIDSLPAMEEG